MEHKSCNIGITETGDPCFDFSWCKKLQEANIIITKGLNDRIIKELIKHKDKIILHLTCTGNGGTALEPNVPKPQELQGQLEKLISMGFNINQVVLRVDPIILNTEFCMNAFVPVELFKHNIKRLRFSFLNMFSSCGARYNIKQDIGINEFSRTFIKEATRYYTLESCSGIKNNNVIKNACISETDMEILNKNIILYPNNRKRGNCNIPSNAIELLEKNNCKHGCKYCYLRGKI